MADTSTARQQLVSIITPSFNQAKWLPDNLHSVACQTYPHIEHVVADGGSSDGSVELLTDAGDSVHWVSEPDSGQADAINRAFARSRGEIIGWLNSDDAYFDCRVIADVVAHFAAHPNVDVVYGHCVQTAQDGLIIQVLWAPPFDYALLRTLDFITQPAAFFRREAVGDRLLDDRFHFAMDYELWLRLATASKGFGRIDRITAIDRHQPQRKSSTMKDVHAENLTQLSAAYETRFGTEWNRQRSRFYIRQRLMGALLIPGIKRSDLAFGAPDDPKVGLWRRQIASRRSSWPAEYR